MASSSLSTALAISFIKKGSWRAARDGRKKERASSKVRIPLCTSSVDKTGSMPSSADRRDTASASTSALGTQIFSFCNLLSAAIRTKIPIIFQNENLM